MTPARPSGRSRWLYRPQAQAAPEQRLICFPYAGSAPTAFKTWPAHLPANVELCAISLPTRGVRLTEPPMTDMDELLETLARELEAVLVGRFSFFGHSMGAAIAYELVHRLRERGRPLPERLFVSGRRAPGLPRRVEVLHRLPLDELLPALQRFFGTPAALLENPDMQTLVLPGLRADLELIERWESPLRPPLAVPITALGGETDPGVERAELSRWSECTSEGFDMFMLPGEHFFLHTAESQLLGLVSRALRAGTAADHALQKRKDHAFIDHWRGSSQPR